MSFSRPLPTPILLVYPRSPYPLPSLSPPILPLTYPFIFSLPSPVALLSLSSTLAPILSFFSLPHFLPRQSFSSLSLTYPPHILLLSPSPYHPSPIPSFSTLLLYPRHFLFPNLPNFVHHASSLTLIQTYC